MSSFSTRSWRPPSCWCPKRCCCWKQRQNGTPVVWKKTVVAHKQSWNRRAMINRGSASTMAFFPPSATSGNGNQNTTAAATTTRMRSGNGYGNRDTDNNMTILKNANQQATFLHQHGLVGEWREGKCMQAMQRGEIRLVDTERGKTPGWCREGKDTWLMQRGEGYGVDNGLDRGRVTLLIKCLPDLGRPRQYKK